MIYAVTKPIEEYNVTLESGNVYGLHSTYCDNPPLLALIMICTPLPYAYEMENKRDKDVQVDITDIKPFEDTLKVILGGKTVEELLETLNPLEFYNEVTQYDLSALPLVVEVLNGEPEPLKLVIKARVAAWGAAYKGPLKSSGNLTSVCFGGVEIPEELKECNRTLKEKLWKTGSDNSKLP